MSGGRYPAVARPRGRHALRSRRLAASLVRDAGVAPGDLVLDVGAGAGAITRELVRAGARVLAVELDARDAAALRKLGVRVVEADALALRWPAEPFSVVANLPFAGSTGLLRSLLEPIVPLVRAELVVEWGLACKRTRVWPSTLLGVYWGAWHELTLVRRLSPFAFAPPPAVAAAVLRATRRPEPLVPVDARRPYRELLQRAYASDAPVRRLLGGRALTRAAELGLDRAARARDLDAHQWATVFASVHRTR